MGLTIKEKMKNLLCIVEVSVAKGGDRFVFPAHRGLGTIRTVHQMGHCVGLYRLLHILHFPGLVGPYCHLL